MNKRHLRVIQEIQERIPKELLLGLMKEQPQAPTIRKVIEAALADPKADMTPRHRRRLQALLDSGELDRKVQVLDETVEKQIDNFMSEEIDKAVKLGRLPKEAPKLEALQKKGEQYARRQEKRLRKEFLGEADDATHDSEDHPENEGEHPNRQNDGGLLLEPGR